MKLFVDARQECPSQTHLPASEQCRRPKTNAHTVAFVFWYRRAAFCKDGVINSSLFVDMFREFLQDVSHSVWNGRLRFGPLCKLWQVLRRMHDICFPKNAISSDHRFHRMAHPQLKDISNDSIHRRSTKAQMLRYNRKAELTLETDQELFGRTTCL